MARTQLARDIILIAGQACSGKTTALNILSKDLEANGLRSPSQPVVDARYYLQRLVLDDQKGGYGHYHDWCEPADMSGHKGHTHGLSGIVPYAITSQDIVDGALFDFFSALNHLPRGQNLYFAELSGGQNISRPAGTQAGIDVSFTYMAKLLRRDVFPAAWMKRVIAVVHPVAEPRNLYAASFNRMATRQADITAGIASPQKELTTLDVLGKDDFAALEPLLKENGTHRVRHITNAYDERFADDLGKVSEEVTEDTLRQATLLDQNRDLILVCGQHSTGIPQIISQLKHRAALNNIPYEEEVISELPILIDKVREDDLAGGRNHYHKWCEGKTEGHVHDYYDSDKSFTIVGNKLIDAMYQDYFAALAALPRTGKLRFAELAGGENTNPFSEPAYATDCSFKRMTELLHERALPASWANRVLAVVHPIVTSENVRLEINDADYVESFSGKGRAVIRGRSSQTVLNIYGKDDFGRLEAYLQDRHVPHIFTITHDDTALFLLRLENVIDGVLDYFSHGTAGTTES